MKDKERVVVNYSDNSVGKITDNQFYGNIGNIIIGNNNVVSDENRNMGATNSQISDNEWIQLSRYLFEKQMSSNDEDLRYQDEYEQAENLAKKKDKNGLRNFFNTKGSALLNILMNSAAQVGIKTILEKIMHK